MEIEDDDIQEQDRSGANYHLPVADSAQAGSAMCGSSQRDCRCPRPSSKTPSSNTGEIPHDAIRFDEAGLKAYVRDNTPRPEPVAEDPWTEGEIKSNLGWTETQLRSARANGFPKNTGHRNLFNEEGVPYETVLLWSPALVRSWVNQVHGLAVTGR